MHGMRAASIAALAFLAMAIEPAAALEPCGAGKRVTCVVDGDTLWLAGEKIRLEGIDAPEVEGRCEAERQLARLATARLAQLLTNGEIVLRRNGLDRYGRTLAVVYADGNDVGVVLVREGLARQWSGRRESWCSEGN